MKLKTLVGSMAVLGLISTGAFAVTQPGSANAQSTTTASNNAYWMSIVNRNQDNNGSMVTGLAKGQMKVTGEVALDLAHADKRSNFSDETQNKKGSTRFDLNTAEMYFDSQVTNWASVHAAVDLDANPGTSSGRNNLSGGTVTLPEVYALLTHGNMYVKAGRQYLNFGDTSHDTILAAMAEDLSETNVDALSFGIMNLNGFYANATLFNGAPYGDTVTKVNDSNNKVNGMAAEVGYAMNQGVNQFYGYNGFNAYFDYINNIADTNVMYANLGTTLGTAPDTATTKTKEQVPGMALHGGYVTGPFQVMLNYVAATKKFDAADGFLWKGKGATPAAYDLEADYGWMGAHKQIIALIYGQTMESMDSSYTTNQKTGKTIVNYNNIPQQRIALAYNYYVDSNVVVSGEYDYLKDYGTSDYTSDSTVVTGTGKAANMFTARLKVAF